jgi:hypothetical protein
MIIVSEFSHLDRVNTGSDRDLVSAQLPYFLTIFDPYGLTKSLRYI